MLKSSNFLQLALFLALQRNGPDNSNNNEIYYYNNNNNNNNFDNNTSNNNTFTVSRLGVTMVVSSSLSEVTLVVAMQGNRPG
jgi:hypothetical protein